MVRRLSMMHEFVQKDADVLRVARVPRPNQENLGLVRIVEAPQTAALESGCRALPCLGLPLADSADKRWRFASGPVSLRIEPILET